jgi:D-alanine--poly(phosphoribitol) ligase subunit 1
MDFCQLLGKYAKSDAVAHVYRESTMAYKELEEKSNSLAAYLIEVYGEDKTPIIVYGHKEHNMLICFFACIKSGHAYIPIDSSTPMERVKDIIHISGSNFIFNISDKDIINDNIIILNQTKIVNIFSDYLGIVPQEKYRVNGEDIHYIIYTSGSTGKPKGVKITSNCLGSFINWASNFWDFFNGKHYIFMNQAPFSFDLSVMDLYLSLYTGSTLYSIDKEMISSLKQLFNYLKISNINIWVSTPSFAEMCLADSSFNYELLPYIKLMLFCGETLTNNCVSKLYERFNRVKIINLYGPTETTVAISAIEVDKNTCKNINPLPVGYVKNDCKVFIVSENTEKSKDLADILEFDDKKYLILPEGEKGEIVISGKSVSPGYFNNDEVTKKVFLCKFDNKVETRYYRTGDEGFIKNDLLYYCGRIDFQVKLNGFRVELEDIESNLKGIEFIENALVLPVMKDGKLYYLAAAVTLNRKFEEKDFQVGLLIKERLKRLLPEYMIPRKIIIKEKFPMTSNGKINRKLLMEELK